MRALFFLIPLAACAEPDPEIVKTATWPVRVPGLLTEDLRIALRQTDIARDLRTDPAGVLQELDGTGGPFLTDAFRTAGIARPNQQALIKELRVNRSIYARDIDRLAWDIAEAGRNPDLEW